MKKWIAFLVCVLMLLSLAGCGGKPAEQEPAPEEPAKTETEPETEKTETPETDEGMVEKKVGDSFRFWIPEDWKKQDDGSYEVKTEDGALYVYFFGFPVHGDGFGFPDDFSLDSEDFGETFTEYLNQMQLLSDGTLKLYNSDKQAYETAKGVRYRHIACDVLDASGSKYDYMMFYLYEWSDESYFSIAFDPAYDVPSVRDCIDIIHSTIERID